MGFLVIRNPVGDAQGKADVVPAVQQALAAKGIDRELEAKSGVVSNGLGLQIDGQAIAFLGGDAAEHFVNLCVG